MPRPHREPHPRQLGDVAAAGVDHQAAHAARLRARWRAARRSSRRRRRRRRDHQDVAVRALLDGDVEHPVVARRHADGDRGAGDVRAGVDRAHARRRGGRCGPAPRARSRRRAARSASTTSPGRRAVGCGRRRRSCGSLPHGSSETWMTSSSISPPTARIARSTSARPIVCVASRSSGKRLRGELLERQLDRRGSCGRGRS